MIVSIHQPNFLPYTGFFEKMNLSDKFVILDNVQYSKGDWHNRNYIRGIDNKILLTIPVSVKYGQKINEVEIYGRYKPEKIWKTIEMNYRKSKFFDLYKDELRNIFFMEYNRLIELNINLIFYLKNVLEINTDIIICSDIEKEDELLKSTERLVDICKKVKGNIYLSGEGGLEYLNEKYFIENNIHVIYQKFKQNPYEQKSRDGNFIENLSILDVLFNCGPEWKNTLGESNIIRNKINI